MKKWIWMFCLVLFNLASLKGQGLADQVVIVTLDGMRWQEIFKGIDTVLMKDSSYVRDRKELKSRFWGDTESERRAKLMPFIWSELNKNGRLYGNRTLGNKVNNANRYWFSYPGYNEIFTGYPDTTVNSNDKVYNKNVSVLEYLNQTQKFKHKIAAFSTWDVFPFILNQPRSHIYVNSDIDELKFNTPRFQLINDWQRLTTKPIGVRPDVITYIAAKEYLMEYKPRVLYISFDETDDYAHGGMYDQYLASAHAEDAMINDLWNTLQSMDAYRNKTTLIITTDHGRGDKIKSEWRDHGQGIRDASEIWIAMMGPGIYPSGEVKSSQQIYQAQLASTIAGLLGMEYKPDHPVYAPINTVKD